MIWLLKSLYHAVSLVEQKILAWHNQIIILEFIKRTLSINFLNKVFLNT